MARVFGVLRLALAVLLAAAVFVQFAVSRAANDDPARFTVEYFSYFTITTALLTVVVLVAAGVTGLRGRPEAVPLTTARVFATAYSAVVALVYNLLLRATFIDDTTIPWSNETLHVVAPALLVADLLLAPGAARVPWRRLWLVVVYPLVWAGYALVHGVLSGWYPYPFLDPSGPGGIPSVLGYVVAIAIGMLAGGAILFALTRARTQPAAPLRG